MIEIFELEKLSRPSIFELNFSDFSIASFCLLFKMSFIGSLSRAAQGLMSTGQATANLFGVSDNKVIEFLFSFILPKNELKVMQMF